MDVASVIKLNFDEVWFVFFAHPFDSHRKCEMREFNQNVVRWDNYNQGMPHWNDTITHSWFNAQVLHQIAENHPWMVWNGATIFLYLKSKMPANKMHLKWNLFDLSIAFFSLSNWQFQLKISVKIQQ